MKIKSYKHTLSDAQKIRKVARQKFYTKKYDELFVNGDRIEFAFLRLSHVASTIEQAVNTFDSKREKRITNAQKVWKKSECLHDYVFLKKLKFLLPDDRKLRDEYVRVVEEIQNTLLSIGKKK